MGNEDRVGLRPAPSVRTRLFDGELVILDLAGGEYFALDPIGSALWTGLEFGRSVDEIARQVAAEYDVTVERAVVDLDALVDDLVARGLLVAGVTTK